MRNEGQRARWSGDAIWKDLCRQWSISNYKDICEQTKKNQAPKFICHICLLCYYYRLRSWVDIQNLMRSFTASILRKKIIHIAFRNELSKHTYVCSLNFWNIRIVYNRFITWFFLFFQENYKEKELARSSHCSNANGSIELINDKELWDKEVINKYLWSCS